MTNFLQWMTTIASGEHFPTDWAPTSTSIDNNCKKVSIDSNCVVPCLCFIDNCHCHWLLNSDWQKTLAGPELSHRGRFPYFQFFIIRGFLVQPKFSTKLCRKMDYNLYEIYEIKSSLCFNKCLLGRVPIKVSNNQSMKILLLLHRIVHFVQNLIK